MPFRQRCCLSIKVIGGTARQRAAHDQIIAIDFKNLVQTRIAFLSRHGDGHTLSPSEVPFAANIFALKQLGVHAGFSLGGGIDVPGVSGSASASCTYDLGYVFKKTSGECAKPFCQGVQLDGECCLEANIYFGSKWFQVGKRWKKCIEATLAGPACMKN